MNTKNMELEKPLDKVTLLGVDSQLKEGADVKTQETSPKENIEEKMDSKEEKYTEKREFHPVENYHPENDRHSHSKGLRIFGFSILLFIILLCIAFLIFTFVNSKNENIISGISIKDVNVSGLSTEKAKETIQNYINENLPENINLVHNDYETSIPLSALNVNFDVDSAVNYAYQIGKSGNIFDSNDLKVINFNEYFDTKVDNKLIAENSLNGKFIQNILKNETKKLDDEIEKQLEEKIISINQNRKLGKKKQYNLGEIVEYDDYLLTSLTKFTDDNRAILSLKEYLEFLMNFWDNLRKGKACG